MKISCDIAKDLMQLDVDELLSDDSRELLREHLDSCESCREEREETDRRPLTPSLTPGETNAQASLWTSHWDLPLTVLPSCPPIRPDPGMERGRPDLFASGKQARLALGNNTRGTGIVHLEPGEKIPSGEP